MCAHLYEILSQGGPLLRRWSWPKGGLCPPYNQDWPCIAGVCIASRCTGEAPQTAMHAGMEGGLCYPLGHNPLRFALMRGPLKSLLWQLSAFVRPKEYNGARTWSFP